MEKNQAPFVVSEGMRHKKIREEVGSLKTKWTGWAVSEAFIRVISNAFQKTIGDLMQTVGPVLYGTAVMGLVQAFLGFTLAKTTKQKIVVDRTGIIGSILFGAIATFCIIFSFLVFAYGGILSLHVFIVTLGIVPGAVIDRLFFKCRFNKLNALGIFVAILAGWVALGAPNLSELGKLPLWMLFSFLTMLGMTVNQGITQKIQKINPLVKNFWGGTTIFLLAGTSVLFFGSINPISAYPGKIAIVSGGIGILSVVLWAVNLYAYRGGAFIALKKLVVYGSSIIIGALWGKIFFSEPLTLFHGMGFIIYCIAFVMIDRDTLNFVRSVIKREEIGSKQRI